MGSILLSSVEAKCGRQTKYPTGKTINASIVVNDTNFGPTERHFLLDIPKHYHPNQKYPLFFYQHGWSGHDIDNMNFLNESRRNGVISVFPQGMGDYPPDNQQSWNVPYKPKDPAICLNTTQGMCYDSCKALGLCYACSWSTCYDDVQFIDELMVHLKKELCVDQEKTVISGASNGAMFVYYLAGQRPKLFKGWLLEYGQPLIGYLDAPKALKDTYFLSLHGRQDVLIPAAGGIDGSDEWIYESVDNMVKGWATTQDCDLSSYKRVKTPFDNYVTDATQSGYNLKCYEYTKGCQGRVMRCKYKGTHGEDIPYDAKLSHWYFNGKYEHKEVENETFFIQ